jgi:hypothetical protein
MKREDLGVKPGQSEPKSMLGWVLVIITIAVAFGLVAALLMS